VTLQLVKILRALVNEPLKDHYGLELARDAGLATGTTYPILARLEEEGWLTSDWEQIDPVAEGRRPRRYYRLTGAGETAARDVLQTVAETAAPGLPSPVHPRLRGSPA
jgi:DNA-binding PadR family transcriptional regulator